MRSKTSIPDLEDFGRVLGIVSPFVEEYVSETRAYDSGNHDIGEQYPQPFLRSTLMPKHFCHYVVAENESNGKSETIPSDGYRSETEQDRISVPSNKVEHIMEKTH